MQPPGTAPSARVLTAGIGGDIVTIRALSRNLGGQLEIYPLCMLACALFFYFSTATPCLYPDNSADCPLARICDGGRVPSVAVWRYL